MQKTVARHRQRRRLGALLGIACAVAAGGLIACGEDEQDVDAILDQAFAEPIGTADVTLNLDVQLEGSERLPEPVRVQAVGPYRSGAEGEPPSFDFDVSLQGLGAEIPPIGLISTGDDLFVEFAGTAYAASTGPTEPDTTDLGDLGVDPRPWIEDAEIEDEVEVAGVPTTHLSATVDVPALLADINQAAESAPDVGAGPAPTLSEEELDQLAAVITEPRFDLFVAEDDGKVRRLTAAATLDPPPGASTLSDIESGTVVFSIEFANVGGDQQIEAPASPRPITDLFQQLFGLGQLLGGAGGSAPPAPGGGASAPGGGGTGGLDVEAFVRYGACLEQVEPGDQQALADCAELLER